MVICYLNTAAGSRVRRIDLHSATKPTLFTNNLRTRVNRGVLGAPALPGHYPSLHMCPSSNIIEPFSNFLWVDIDDSLSKVFCRKSSRDPLLQFLFRASKLAASDCRGGGAQNANFRIGRGAAGGPGNRKLSAGHCGLRFQHIRRISTEWQANRSGCHCAQPRWKILYLVREIQ
jgi:hypothetical protein